MKPRPRRSAQEREHLVEVRAQLNRALGVLRERLVSIYEAGSPDVLNAILESEDWSSMAAQTEYLNRIQSYDNSVVGRVKTLRNEVETSVGRLTSTQARIEDARNSIAATEAEVAAAKEAAEARFAELQVAQAQRRETMNALESKEQALSDNLSSISEQIAAQRAEEAAANAEASGIVTEAAGEFPAPLNAGESVGFISESEASAPEAAPEQVKGAVAAANAIAMTPYIWGGGHGSFESSGYDCSGAVSYALHGGGLLESPLDSTGLETWGEAGPGQVDHGLRQRRARLDDHRRPRLRHRRRPRPALAHLAGGFARKASSSGTRPASEPRPLSRF